MGLDKMAINGTFNYSKCNQMSAWLST